MPALRHRLRTALGRCVPHAAALLVGIAAPAFAQAALTATMAVAPPTIRSGAPADLVVTLRNTAAEGSIGGIEFDVVFPATMHRQGTPIAAQCNGVVAETAGGFGFRNGSLGAPSTCEVRFPVTVEQDDDGDVSLTIDAVRSANGGATGPISAVVHVLGGIAPTITSPPPPSQGFLGLEYRHVVTVAGTKPITVEAKGLPPGVSYDDATRTISGKPTVEGDYVVSLRAINSAAFGDAQITPVKVVNPPLQFTTLSPLPPQPVLVPVSIQLDVVGGLKPYTFDLVGGALPPGVALGRMGRIGGTATAPGAYRFSIRVRDALSQVVTQVFDLVVGGGGPGGVLTLDLAPNPAVAGQVVVITAKVASLATAPTGTVDLWIAGAGNRCPDPFESGSAPVTPIARSAVLSQDGIAQFVFPDLGVGTLRVCARYGGSPDVPAAMQGPVELYIIKGVVLDGMKADGDAQPVPALAPGEIALLALFVALAGALRSRRR